MPNHLRRLHLHRPPPAPSSVGLWKQTVVVEMLRLESLFLFRFPLLPLIASRLPECLVAQRNVGIPHKTLSLVLLVLRGHFLPIFQVLQKFPLLCIIRIPVCIALLTETKLSS